jgi:hypothetical protein
MSGDAPHGILIILNCGLKLGVKPNFTRAVQKKSAVLLKNCFIFEKAGQAFEPSIE